MSSEPVVPPGTSAAAGPAGPLAGLRVVELASEAAAYCGKLLADLGAEVILVEPRAGHPTRWYEPFVDDVPHPDRSLWFWTYNTSKLGVGLDLDNGADADLFRRLVSRADVVLEAEPLGRLRALDLDHDTLRATQPSLVWTSVTPFGRATSRSQEQATDLTISAGGGMAWSCGYDDKSLPPVRGSGGQSNHTASLWAAIATLVALHSRNDSGEGQFIDVSMHAAVNVTTEQATQYWLVAGKVVQRQTGRHASHRPTEPLIANDINGHEVHTGFPPRTQQQLTALLEWLDVLGIRGEFPAAAFLEIAVAAGGIDLSKLHDDPMVQECYRAAREAMIFVASRITAHQFFVQAQERGIPVGAIYAPEEVMTDPHIVARGFPTLVFDHRLGREVIYPGAPIRFTRSPWRISRPAPDRAQDQTILDTI